MFAANMTRFKTAEQARTVYVYTVEDRTPFAEVLKPSYWAHIADTLRPFDMIEVRPDDESYFALLIVLKKERTWAQVGVLSHVPLHEIPKAEAPKVEEFEVAWKGPHNKYCVIRNSDKKIIHEYCVDKKSAYDWIVNYTKTMGTAVAA